MKFTLARWAVGFEDRPDQYLQDESENGLPQIFVTRGEAERMAAGMNERYKFRTGQYVPVKVLVTVEPKELNNEIRV